MPRVFLCPECKREIDDRRDKYEVVAEKPEVRMHPECREKRRKRASEARKES